MKKLKKNPVAISTFVSDNEIIIDALKGFDSYQDFERLLGYIKTLNDDAINRLDKACNNKKKALNKDIDMLWRDPKWKKDNDNRNLNDKAINKLNRICNFKNHIQWIKLAIKQIREEREKDKEDRRINIVEQNLDKFENYIENTAMEIEKNIEFPACSIKCDKSPLKKRAKNKNKLLHMSTG